uniref:exodeoxyribonuclease III n=1 Tax=Pygocentrus nattereri TaxID=42514 RepID=A0AAR2LBN1_PYGNA
MSTLRFVTWNVRGAGSREKRLKIFNRLSDLQADIVFLQETHMSKTPTYTLTSPQFPHAYSACYNSKQRGVAILINRRIHFSISNNITDPEGRFIILNLSILNMHLCIANIYGPNVDDPSFFHNIFTALSDHSDTKLIIGGDFNLVLHPKIDSPRTNIGSKSFFTKTYTRQRGITLN